MPIAVLLAQRGEHVGAALAPANRRQQRVQHGRAVRMQAQPVVREDFVRQRGIALARELEHAHAGACERERQRVEFAQCVRGLVAGPLRGALKEVRARGLRVVAESGRPHHQHGPRRLWLVRRGQSSVHHATNSPKSIRPSSFVSMS